MKSSFKLCIILIIVLYSTILSAKTQNDKLKAFTKSLIIPGWGEYSNKHYSSYIFFATETSLWLSKYYYLNLSDNKFSKSKTYAYQKANMTYSEKPSDYYDMIGKYRSSGYDVGGYNADVVAKAKELFNTAEEQKQYIEENALDDSIYWYWDSSSDQKQYKILRKDGFNYKDTAKVIGGIVIFNHVLSAINAARVAKKKTPVSFSIDLNDNLQPMLSYNIKF